ncbi:hypothetical protein BO86DRAFT_410235 [Aspergillus japonicus CBS 114.51]|uniref:Uncharacterized protein n=1 Tax=Aspergillus japonicus CBS 114.51 TaxID=1448312 RepID=A0A8T8WZV7_ASPJA|nr:hypothetical protein BO86DRAFT_410235 [Aspergillus japonicus CBS 114.51]RAH81408.1 hypothetical protein BO86DRAFT_410235 [Aspergillus japonicus CBS 114.51]
MTLLYVRAVVPFEAGANSTDVLINEVHFNRTALDIYHYKLYSNGTLSNGTDCYLAFNQFKPHMQTENGTVIKGVSCYAPVRDIGSHAAAGLAFALMFSISIFFTLLNLRKHGRRYLPHDRRWRLLGRRAKWIWMLVLAGCGAISCFMSIDVDRDYVVNSPLVLQSVFYTILTPVMMAVVWEAVRHWGSWQERQIIDRDPYAFSKSSTRRGQEFVLPMIFYGLALANFFLTVPRSWGPIEMQRSLEQEMADAKPAATDIRWRIASFLAMGGVLVICYSLEHSLYRYRIRPTSTWGQLMFYLNAAPSQFLVALVLLGFKVGYAIASAYDWTVSPLRYGVSGGWIYGLGYTPPLLLIVLFNICGHCELNDDQAIIARRGDLDNALADDMGVGQRKPSWWTKGRSFVREIRRQSTQKDTDEMDRYVEMGIINPEEQQQQQQQQPGEDPFAKPKPETQISPRTASQGSEATSMTAVDSGSEVAHRHMEYVTESGNLSRCSSDDPAAVHPPQRARDMIDG